MSQIQGQVSLWVGRAQSSESLEAYMLFTYPDDAEAILPAIAQDFEIDWFDEDSREARIISPSTVLLLEALKGFSYDDVIIPRFIELHGRNLDSPVNAVVLLYDFEYDGHVPEVSTPNIQLKFIGVVSYQ